MLLLLPFCFGSCAKQKEPEAATAGPQASLVPRPAPDAAGHSPLSELEPIPQQADSVLIRSGSLPLVHLFDQGGAVRIVDVTSRQTLLSAVVSPGSIISVTDSGILVGRQRRLTTALDPGHRYELWWDNQGRRR